MTRKKIALTCRILEVIIQMLLFWGVMTFVYFGALKMPTEYWYKTLYVCLATILAYIFRQTVKKFILFALGHIMLIAGAILIGSSENESFFIAIVTVLVCFMSVVQLKRRENPYPEKIHVAAGLLFVVIYYLSYKDNSELIMRFASCQAMAFIIAQIFYTSFVRMDELYNQHTEKYNFPERRLFDTNMLFLVIVGTFALFGMLLFYNGSYGNILGLLRDGLLLVLGFILRGLLSSCRGSEAPQYETNQEVNVSGEFDMGEYVSGDMQAVINAVMIVLAVAIIIGMLILAYKAIKRGFYFLSKKHVDEEDIVEAIDTVEALGTDEYSIVKEDEISDKDLNIRARKFYKKKVRTTFKDKNYPGAAKMPSDISPLIAEKEKADEFTRIYEKARYSSKPVTEQEVEFLKKG